MTTPTPPGTLKLLSGALVTLGQGSQAQTLGFQFNPTTLRRNLQSNTVGAEQGDRSQAVRFSGAAVETLSLDARFDATTALDQQDQTAEQYGIYPQLSALALLAYPSTQQVDQSQSMLNQGDIEVLPLIAPRTIFVWGPKRVLPVRLTQFTIQEQFFSNNLNPIRATVTLELRVLSYSDVAQNNPDYHLFMVYQQGLEQMAALAPSSGNTGVSSGQF